LKAIQGINNVLHYISQIILAIMAFLITLDVLGRWLFRTPITGATELVENGLSLLIFLSLAITHIYKEHITIDFIVEKFSQRVQYVFDGLINLAITILMVLMGISIFIYAGRMQESNIITGDLGIPVSLFAFICAIGSLFFALTAFLHAIQFFQKGVKQNEH